MNPVVREIPAGSGNSCWLKGKTAMVTGATSGLGSALVRRLRADGARAIAHGRTASRLAPLVEEGVVWAEVAGDLETKGGCGAVAQAIKQLAPDVLVLNAGCTSEKKLASESTDEEMARMLQVNLLAPIQLARAFARVPVGDGYRRLALVLSTSCLHVRPQMGGYVAAKTGLMGFGRVLQQEMHELRIRTLLLFPGRMDTEIRPGAHPEYTSAESAAEAIVALLRLPDDLVPYELVFRPPADTRI